MECGTNWRKSAQTHAVRKYQLPFPLPLLKQFIPIMDEWEGLFHRSQTDEATPQHIPLISHSQMRLRMSLDHDQPSITCGRMLLHNLFFARNNGANTTFRNLVLTFRYFFPHLTLSADRAQFGIRIESSLGNLVRIGTHQCARFRDEPSGAATCRRSITPVLSYSSF